MISQSPLTDKLLWSTVMYIFRFICICYYDGKHLKLPLSINSTARPSPPSLFRRNNMTTVKLHHMVDDLGISEGLYGLVRRIEETTTKVSATLKVWLRRIDDRRQLSHMNDRLLADIGLSRADVAVEIKKNFWQK